MSDREFEAYAALVMAELVPKLQDSAVVASLVPRGESDVKYAVELGMSIMLDKPIILVVHPGQEIPDHLRRVADAIVEWGPSLAQRLTETIDRLGLAT